MEINEVQQKNQKSNILNFEKALKDYSNGLNSDLNSNWRIAYKEEFGRCMVANRDIEPNELIFIDKPVIIGPRVSNYEKIFCVCCYKILPKLILCVNKCKLPVCGDCTNSRIHKPECDLIRSWKLKNESRYSKFLFRALTVIRGLLLSAEDKRLVELLECHTNSPNQNMEVDRIVDEFEVLKDYSDAIEEMKRHSSVLNTNAFETYVRNGNEPQDIVSLRALYPVAAGMNHCCVPNIRYVFRGNQTMAVYAAKQIKKDEQIFNSYTRFLWGSQQRRYHLAYSKKFLCKCERCMDPTEFNSLISAIKCIHPNCSSYMLPINPLLINSPWKCNDCGFKLDHTKASRIQDIFSKRIFNKILKEKMTSINQYLKEKLLFLLPESNQFVIEVKLQIIFKLKHEEGYQMTLDDYQDIERYCNDVLEIIDKLGTGDCFVRGLLYYEIVSAKLNRIEYLETPLDNKTKSEIKRLLQKCWIIVGNSVQEPNNLRKLIENYG